MKQLDLANNGPRNTGVLREGLAPSRAASLSSQLSELLKIKDVQVITSESNDLTLNTVGRAAASALLKNLRDNQTIAISWGRGLEATVVNTHSETLSGLKVT